MRTLGDAPHLPLPNLQEFSEDGVWTRPDGALILQVVGVGGGGGGGGGDVGGAGTNGGGAGGGGHFASITMAAHELPPTINVAVGQGGAGGASTVSGTAGSDSVFGASFFPEVGGVTNGAATGVSSVNVLLPEGSNLEGLLLLVAVATSDTETLTWPSGWTELNAGNTGGGGARMETRYRFVDGTEGFDGSVDTIPLSAATAKAWGKHAWQISGAGTPQMAVATGSGTVADAPNFAPTGGSQKYLWIVQAGWDGTEIVTGFPYADNQNENTTDGTVTLARCSKLAEATSDNPAAFTVGTGDWRAMTIAVFAATVGWPTAINGGTGGSGGAGATAAEGGEGTVYSGTGGGGGGGRDGGGGGAAQAGAAGGAAPEPVLGTRGGGAAGGAAGVAGTAGAAGDSTKGGQGGGGGGANAAGTGAAGGAGGDVGGGGGGGGAGSAAGGVGGNGADGRVWIYAF